MRTRCILAFLLSTVACTVLGAPRTLSRDVLLDKIRGGWAGQMIGVAYGAPTEFHATGRTYDQPINWKPESVENSLHQDDLYVEMTFARVMDTIGLNATCEQYGEAFKTSKYKLWHANAGARRALNMGIKAPWSGHPQYNFHANDIDFQIEADFIGLMCPGLPRMSNRLCDRVGRVMNYGDGLYGGMFVCGMYSAAYFESDPRKIVEAGLGCIPAKSEYGLLIRDVLEWSGQHPTDWRKVWQLLEDKWDKNDACPAGALSAFNIDAKLNGAYIAMGLLFGQGTFEKTLEVATRCGQDSDCNPSSAAGVLGVVTGYRAIPDFYKGGIPALENNKFDFTDYSMSDIVKSTEVRVLKAIEMAGGKVSGEQVVVPLQKPKAPKLEQWSPGVPDRHIPVKDASWTFQGAWRDDRNEKVIDGTGGEATLRFNGRAVAIIGRMGQSSGRAEVYVDGKQQKQQLDGYIVENTTDDIVWQIYGLKPGEHQIRLVTLDQADDRSKGKQVNLRAAVTYR
jgi:hypothetical protein